MNELGTLNVESAMKRKWRGANALAWLACLNLCTLLSIGCTTTRTWVDISRSAMPSSAHISKEPFSAELEFDTFAEGERLKLDGVWASSRDNQFRIDLRAPTGGVVFSFATDGHRLSCYDARAGRYFEGAALPRSFDLLLPMAPLELDASQWLELLLGNLQIPDDSVFGRADDGTFRAVFRQGEHWVEALLDEDGLLSKVTIAPEAPKAVVSYGDRDLAGRSIETLIEDSEGRYRMRMRLRDIRVVEQFRDTVFRIRAPKGVERIALD